MPKTRARLQLPSATLLLLVGLIWHTARAHEFWIEPLAFGIEPGDLLQAHLNVGQRLQGYTLLYLPEQFERFDLTVGDQTGPVASRIGDSPAVRQRVLRPGLHILSYVSKDTQLVYANRQKFERFLREEGIEWVKEAHARRGLPDSGFKELFQRFAKSLIEVGDGQGSDRPLGLTFELVVETNPYREPLNEIEVQLLWHGKPFPNAQINIFRRRYDEVHRSHLITDAQGRIRIPVDRAPGFYLLNAVHMIEPPPNDQGIVWKSLWASTTFQID